jgi:molecular chaperone IbpA
MNTAVPFSKTTPQWLPAFKPEIDRLGIGFDEVFSSLHSLVTQSASNTPKYPPYNLYRKDDQYTIDLALAGFTKDEISITKKDRTLTIEGSKSSEAEDPKEEMLYRGMAKRNFSLNFALAAYIEVVSAEMRDGVLKVNLRQDIPEEKKPKVIDIAG